MKTLILFLIFALFVVSCQQEDVSPPTPTPEPTPESTTVTDIDGNEYDTVQIGTQVWMAENLRTTKYANGDPIPNVTDDTQWTNLTTGAWCHYNNDSQYENPYGKLYNWYAVDDSRNVCPTGWHVPTDEEWTTLIDYLDPNAQGGGITPNTAGGKMKSTGTEYWLSPNVDATNESGFSGLPGGWRYYDAIFEYVSLTSDWWSSTTVPGGPPSNAWYRRLQRGVGWVYRYGGLKEGGLSVRCLKD